MNRSILSAFGLCAVLACIAAPAAAQEEVVNIPVSYADLNLASRAGAAVFRHRIDNAIGVICGGAPNMLDLNRSAAVKSCRRQVWSDAEGKMQQAMAESKFSSQEMVLAAAR